MHNDVRKRLFFLNTPDFDVEVKSWVSEIGRANYYKKFGLKKMPTQLSPRQMTSMYKFFTYNRGRCPCDGQGIPPVHRKGGLP